LDIPYYREYRLPWSQQSGQERKFRRLLAIILGVSFFLGVVWPWIPTPAVDPNEVDEIPPRIAKLLLEQKPPPPPPPKTVEPEPEPEAIKEPEPEMVADEPPPPEPEPEIDYQQVAREQALHCCRLPKTWRHSLTVTSWRRS
jgi:outer membrane biosynthesis protein TonB